MAEICDRLSNDPALRYRAARRCSITPAHASPPRSPQPPDGSPPCRTSRAPSRRWPIGGGRHGRRLLHARCDRRVALGDPTSQHLESESGTATPPRTSRSTRPCGHHFQLTSPWSPRSFPRRDGVSTTLRAQRDGPLQRASRRRDGALQRRSARMGLLPPIVAAPGAGRRPGLHAMVGRANGPSTGWRAHAMPALRSSPSRPVHLVPGQALRLHGWGRREIVRLRSRPRRRSELAST